MKNQLSGEVAYLLGIAIAIVMSFLPDNTGVTDVSFGISATSATLILVVLGLVIGLLCFRANEPFKLLGVTIGLMIAGSFGLDAISSFSMSSGMPLGSSITILSAPIALILCLKILIDRARIDSV